jgi:hypothetical protein
MYITESYFLNQDVSNISIEFNDIKNKALEGMKDTRIKIKYELDSSIVYSNEPSDKSSFEYLNHILYNINHYIITLNGYERKN